MSNNSDDNKATQSLEYQTLDIFCIRQLMMTIHHIVSAVGTKCPQYLCVIYKFIHITMNIYRFASRGEY